ncbi:RNA methyltransferase, TrmH family [Hathewaya proteolytica DSM 3090]|uniref:RNA methyltransferase, TrmH family n=1 Tax=Hathewaya proteolytica DSM 3090 TaxID=1121331 RepID=A0A1M6QSD3_9CLOT|nr:RNA methyltransferase [Hathewaya proteolytica]SHK23065.1 RNA methyltransferase, TrmH family [Hathewaya proteolytica DSM 3090]
MRYQNIESKNNEVLKKVKKLKDKKYRDAERLFIAEGIRFVEEAVKTQFPLKYIFVSKDQYDNERINSILKGVDDSVSVNLVPHDLFKGICSTENPQGILAVAKTNSEFTLVSPKEKKGFYVFVDCVQDPGNLGTIIRTAHAAGALGVILRKGTVDLYNEKTLRSSMGSVFHLPVICDMESDYLMVLKHMGYTIISSSLDTNNNFYNINCKKPLVIVLGNEGNGISSEILKISDELVKIPMPGGAESMNVGVAAGILMYEIVRQNS